MRSTKQMSVAAHNKLETEEDLRLRIWPLYLSQVRLLSLPSILVLGLVVLLNASSLHAQVPSSPQQLKLDAIEDLRQISTTNKHLQHIIKRAIRNLSKSLEYKGRSYFLDGYRILPPPDGERVFREEQNAVQWLLRAMRRRHTSEEIKVLFQHVIDALIEADRKIAELSILTAAQLLQAGTGNSRKLSQAQQEFERALSEFNPRKTIQRFRKAWELSQEVVNGRELVIKKYDHSPDPFSPSLATNDLSVTFKILHRGSRHKGLGLIKKLRRDDDDDDDDDDRNDKYHRGDKYEKENHEMPPILELIEVIQDSSGNILRTITTEHTLPPPTPGHKDHYTELTVTSAWDGKNANEEIVPDGTYSYLAFGHLVKKDGSSWRKEHRPSNRWWHRYRKPGHRKGQDQRKS